MRDPYHILGLAPGAGTAEIKAAYRRLAKQYHPDAQGAETPGGVASRFQEVTAAYNLLKDGSARARFDALAKEHGAARASGSFEEASFAGGRARSTAFEAGGPGETGGAEEASGDIFSELFGGLRNAGKRVFRARGEDRTYKLSVPFLEAARGGKRRVALASGKELDVRIPAGIEDGQQIRLRGQGGEGFGGAPAGDALISVSVEPHETLRREGVDVYMVLAVSLPEAVLGTKVEIETVSGLVTLTIPAGSNTGTRLRLKGKGIAPEGGAAGDQYVTLELSLPDTQDSALRDFAAGWAPGLSHEPRKKSQV
ncbi:MAG: DnaJ domain-containing protein [Parvibaculum sp.]|uniref:DnaJ C-terminal domain-containing protein n=1 Tax=Parvibaculum sp. TaxID=2024848 RepID=UPI0025F5AB6F|nr:DnaJ C-terminal domain-containing protein [Parvibaculum sp.]MCE9649687.1 DnaJ domain-containing protein [Parvibaculum sp.]